MTKKTFGELQIGDFIPGIDGPVQVVEVYEEHIPSSMYRLEFDNGTTLDASGNHLIYVVSPLDRSLHSTRIKTGARVLATLSKHSLRQLLELAVNYDEPVEASLHDMLVVMEGEENPEMVALAARVAESLGPIAEETVSYQDLSTGENQNGKPVKKYDARLFAQQVLALKSKRYRKNWPVILGQVVTVENLLLMGDDLEIPEVENTSRKTWLDRIRKTA